MRRFFKILWKIISRKKPTSNDIAQFITKIYCNKNQLFLTLADSSFKENKFIRKYQLSYLKELKEKNPNKNFIINVNSLPYEYKTFFTRSALNKIRPVPLDYDELTISNTNKKICTEFRNNYWCFDERALEFLNLSHVREYEITESTHASELFIETELHLSARENGFLNTEEYSCNPSSKIIPIDSTCITGKKNMVEVYQALKNINQDLGNELGCIIECSDIKDPIIETSSSYLIGTKIIGKKGALFI